MGQSMKFQLSYDEEIVIIYFSSTVYDLHTYFYLLELILFCGKYSLKIYICFELVTFRPYQMWKI